MCVNIWPVTILAISTAVLLPSASVAQSDPDRAPSTLRSLSEPSDRTRLAVDDTPPSEGQDPHPSFLKDVAGDVRRFFATPESGVILSLGLAASLSVRPLDDAIRNSGFNSRSPQREGDELDDLFKAGNAIGSSLVQIGGAFATYTIGRWVGKPHAAELGRDLMRAQLLSGGATRLLKHTVRRTRPYGPESSRTSFPSGHTSGTFASATVLNSHYGWKVGVPAFGLASLVALARCADDSHFLSDVVFGAAIGITAGRAVTFDSGSMRLEVSPLAVSRGVGVLVSVS